MATLSWETQSVRSKRLLRRMRPRIASLFTSLMLAVLLLNATLVEARAWGSGIAQVGATPAQSSPHVLPSGDGVWQWQLLAKSHADRDFTAFVGYAPARHAHEWFVAVRHIPHLLLLAGDRALVWERVRLQI